MIRKRLACLLPILLCLFLLSGCVDAHMHITLRMDGSGVYEFKVVSSDLIISQFNDFKRRLEQNGYRLRTIDHGKRQGWIAVKEVESVTKDPPGKEFQDAARSALGFWLSQTASSSGSMNLASDDPKLKGTDKPFRVEPGLFFTTIIFDTNVDLTKLKRQDLFGLDQLLYDQMNLNFILTLPVKPQDHNATSVSEGGKTLTWKIRPGETNPIHLTVKVPNPITWVILILLLVIGIVTGIVLRIRKRKRNRNQPPGSGSPGPFTVTPETFRWED
jgi:hypothetical protein